MSNLGMYQVMTTLSKKVGGPLVLAGLTALSGYAICRTAESGVKRVVKKAGNSKKAKKYAHTTFTVSSDAVDKQGLEFSKGDTFNVLESDEDAILIEIIGRNDNPHFVSGKFLKGISDFG